MFNKQHITKVYLCYIVLMLWGYAFSFTQSLYANAIQDLHIRSPIRSPFMRSTPHSQPISSLPTPSNIFIASVNKATTDSVTNTPLYVRSSSEKEFEQILDSIDVLLASYIAENQEEDALLFLQWEQRKRGYSWFVFQEASIRIQNSTDVQKLTRALRAISPRIQIQTKEQKHSIFVEGIETHVLHARVPEKNKGIAKLLIIIDDVGENVPLLHDFIQLSIPLTYAVWPFASATKRSSQYLATTKQSTIIHLPMEPFSYPPIDVGKGVITTRMDKEEIESIIQKAFTAVPNAIGINNHMGSRFTSNATSVEYFVTAMARIKENAYIVDSVTHNKSFLYGTAKRHGFKALSRSIFIDNIRTTENTLQQLFLAERLAHKYGKTIAIGHLNNTTYNALKLFIQQKKSTTTLVPIHAY